MRKREDKGEKYEGSSRGRESEERKREREREIERKRRKKKREKGVQGRERKESMERLLPVLFFLPQASKEVKELRDFEAALLKNYQQYLRLLDTESRSRKREQKDRGTRERGEEGRRKSGGGERGEEERKERIVERE
jgi:hypothetical protein